jgi:RHS repeat-associated protein
MPSSPRETLLCRYRYDPLDRSMEWAPEQQSSIQRFYCKSRLATEIQGAAKCRFLQHDDQVLAQQRQMGDNVDITLLATDLQRSVLNALDATQSHPFAYTPYGHHPHGNDLLSLLGFNGERPDPITGHYHLGNGYRQFNPVLMRFNSPDSWSPFGEGGLNAYGYCGGDPRNRVDPTGHWFKALIGKMTANAQKNGKVLRPQTTESLKKTISIAGGEDAIAAHAKINGRTPEKNLIITTLDWHALRIERNLAKFNSLIKNAHLNSEKINRATTRAGESYGIYSDIVKNTEPLKGGAKALTAITKEMNKLNEKVNKLNNNPYEFATFSDDLPPSYDQILQTSSTVRNIRS